MHMRPHTWNKPRPLVSMAGKNSLIEDGVGFIAPSFVHPSSEITNSVIGPYSSIGANCKIINSKMEENIVEADCRIQDAVLSRSLVGIKAKVQGRGNGQVSQLNGGDTSDILLS